MRENLLQGFVLGISADEKWRSNVGEGSIGGQEGYINWGRGNAVFSTIFAAQKENGKQHSTASRRMDGSNRSEE
jgi:hypothetical protein